MRYRIEYLANSADEKSVCLNTFSVGPLEQAKTDARERAPVARRMRKLDGYQIQDLENGGCVVWREQLNA